MKLRMKFKKDRPVMFISHLDMMRTFERAFRRADIPVAFTQGFNPRPKISFTPALSVGITSSSEYMDVEFYEDVQEDDVSIRLNRVLPEGLRVINIGIPDEKMPLSMLNGAMYVVKVALNVGYLQELKKSINILSHQEEIIVQKSTKSGTRSVNIAPFIYKIDLLGNDDNVANIGMTISIGQQGSVSPKLIVLELERTLAKKLELISIHREELFYRKNENNKILPL